MKKLFMFLLVFSLLYVPSLSSQQKMIHAVSEAWPPFVDPSKPREGLSIEIVKAAYKTQGYAMKLEYLPWARAEEGVKDGRYDILPNTWHTEKRTKYLYYSEKYASNMVKFIAVKKDNFQYKNLSSLNGKVIGTIRSYGYGDAFLSATTFKRDEVGDFMLNIKKLIAGRVHLTLEDEIVARVIIANKDTRLLDKIRFVDNPLSTNHLYVTCGLKNPRHEELIDAFNRGLAELKRNGKYEKIMEKYGIDME